MSRKCSSNIVPKTAKNPADLYWISCVITYPDTAYILSAIDRSGKASFQGEQNGERFYIPFFVEPFLKSLKVGTIWKSEEWLDRSADGLTLAYTILTIINFIKLHNVLKAYYTGCPKSLDLEANIYLSTNTL